MTRFSSVLCLAGALGLAACGGGSSPASSAAVAAPTVTPAVAVKWSPQVGDTWQWQLHGTINTAYTVQVYDIDLFEAPQPTIDALKSKGVRIVCYISAGSAENWRPDFNRFQPADMGNALANWPGERWLDTRSANVRAIMISRLDLAVSKGCDAVEPDNVDGYSNTPGFPLTADTQLEFNGFLSAQAHGRGLAVALKNDVAQIPNLVSLFDFAVNEQCFQNNECSAYSAFIAQGKPVFNAEYAPQYQSNTGGVRDALCAQSKAASFHTLILPLKLDDSSRFSCD